MNSHRKTLIPFLIVAGLQLGLSGCVGPGYVETGVYYGPGRRPWFHDDPWMDGHRWYGGGGRPERTERTDIYIAPPRLPSPPKIRLP